MCRFPAQEYVSGASKIPTIIYYDRAGNVKAVGAEAAKEGIYEIAEDEHWVKAEWYVLIFSLAVCCLFHHETRFKLHLRSRVGAGRQLTDKIPPLPPNKTVVEVFADFLAYLLECASSFIQETHANGSQLWASVKDKIHFVLSHPNGWEGQQQAEMRKASVLAKLIPDTTAGHTRVSFVTEGEASLHFSVHNGLPEGVMDDGEGVVIVDAGGGTIDISSYSKNVGEAKHRFEEVASPQCNYVFPQLLFSKTHSLLTGFFHGSVFVTVHARSFLESVSCILPDIYNAQCHVDYLQESPFLADLDNIVEYFDKTTKLRFRNSDEPQYVKFGEARDNDPNYNIRFGQLKIQGSYVAKFFEPSVECIVKAVLDQCKVAHKPISVGRFVFLCYHLA